MKITFRSFDPDTLQISVEIKCTSCGIKDFKTFEELAVEMEKENPTVNEVIEFVNSEYPHWRDCGSINRDYDGEHN